MNGPLLTEKELFYSIRTDNPALSAIREIYFGGDMAFAISELCNYVRENLDIKKIYRGFKLDPTSPLYEKDIKKANDALELNMVSVEVYHKFDGDIDWHFNPTENKYEEWTWQLSRHQQVVLLSRMYYLTKEEKYAAQAVKILSSWIKNAIAPPKDTDGHKTDCWRTIECGTRLESWTLIMALIINSPAVTDSFLIDLLRSLLEHYDRIDRQHTDANWLLIEMSGLYINSLAFPYFDCTERLISLAKSTFLHQIKAQTFADHVQCELTFGYHAVSFTCFANAYRFSIIYNDSFGDEFSSILKGYLHTLIKVVTPSDETPNPNDAIIDNCRSFIESNSDLCADDQFIKWYLTDGKEGLGPENINFIFPYAGYAIFRSSYHSDAVYGLFDCGKFGKRHCDNIIRCHQHEDKLNFIMFLGEKNVVREAGGYAYENSPMRYYSLESKGHNTALINGMGQNRYKDFSWDDSELCRREPILTYRKDGIDYVEATYDEGYGDNAEKLGIHNRRVYFINNKSDILPYFIILDRIKATNESKLEVVWHFDTENLNPTSYGYETDDLDVHFSADRGEVEILCGSVDPYDGWCANKMISGDFRPIPCLHYSLRGNSMTLLTAFVPKSNHGKISSISYSEGKISVIYADFTSLSLDIT